MYAALLPLHSLFRWLVLISLLLSIGRAYYGWRNQKKYTKTDDRLRLITLNIVHIQATMGLWLYIISPIVAYFLANFKTALHEREIRFFGMEHITIMLIAVTLITIGSTKTKRKTTDQEKFKTLAIWFLIGLVLILSSIPWQFSPLTARPYFRGF